MLKRLVLALVCLIAAYVLYVANLPSQPDSGEELVAPALPQIDEQIPSTERQAESLASMDSNDVIGDDQTSLPTKPLILEGTTSRTVTNQLTWEEASEGRLAEILDELFPEHRVSILWSSFKRQHKENHYPYLCRDLSSPKCHADEVRQDTDKDLYWSYEMEETIKSAILSYDNPKGFKLLSVRCKQLVCEVLIAQKYSKPYEGKQMEWKKVRGYLYQDGVLPQLRLDMGRFSYSFLLPNLEFDDHVYFVLAFYEADDG